MIKNTFINCSNRVSNPVSNYFGSYHVKDTLYDGRRVSRSFILLAFDPVRKMLDTRYQLLFLHFEIFTFHSKFLSIIILQLTIRLFDKHIYYSIQILLKQLLRCPVRNRSIKYLSENTNRLRNELRSQYPSTEIFRSATILNVSPNEIEKFEISR